MTWCVTLLCIQCNPDHQSIETSFRISEPNQVRLIEIYKKNGLKQSLNFKSDRWWLNDSLKVRPDAIDNIFRILPGIKVMTYPPKAAWENMISAINEEGVKVIFKNSEGHNIKSWSIGGLTNDERGTYAMMFLASQPYIIHVPGFQGSLASRFNISDDDWRDRMIFDENPTDIIGLSVKYPDQPNQGFNLKYEQDPGSYQVYDHAGQKIITSRGQILSYLESYRQIGAESIENDFQHKNLVLASVPHAIIDIDIKNQHRRSVRFYTMKSVGEHSTERMFVHDGQDFYLAQMRLLHKLFRGNDYFMTK